MKVCGEKTPYIPGWQIKKTGEMTAVQAKASPVVETAVDIQSHTSKTFVVLKGKPL